MAPDPHQGQVTEAARPHRDRAIAVLRLQDQATVPAEVADTAAAAEEAAEVQEAEEAPEDKTKEKPFNKTDNEKDCNHYNNTRIYSIRRLRTECV